jgi:8-oxo-dGTP pyrophosphatase MutT (NUDIX family)
MLKKWRTLDSKLVLDTGFFKVFQETCETHTGRVIDDYFIFEQPDVALVFALTPAKQVVLVRQYKQGVKDFCLELPAGGIDAGEDPASAARRELREETGYSAAEFVRVATNQRSTGKEDVKYHVFVAKEVFWEGAPRFDENENIETGLVSLAELRRLVRSGAINDLGSVSAIYQALDYLEI